MITLLDDVVLVTGSVELHLLTATSLADNVQLWTRDKQGGDGDGLLPARWPLVEPDDFGRQLAGDGEFGGAGRVAWEGAQVKQYGRVGIAQDTLYHDTIDLHSDTS